MSVKKGLRTQDGIQQLETQAQNIQIVALTDDLNFPWGMTFLPDGKLVITERPGRLRLFDVQTRESVMIDGVPDVVYKAQGGLLDVAVHPQFDTNHWLYLSYAVEVPDGFTTRVSRYRLLNNKLEEQHTIFEAQPAEASLHHFGCALLFDELGYLYITMGERLNRFSAQNLTTHLGKVMRVRDDGSVPPDNPFIGRRGVLPVIYSYGHRNPQGITRDARSGRLWVVEHGPQGGDEINLLTAGTNYGWPIISYGEEYGGGKIGEGTHKAGMAQPIHYYTPSIATGGLAFYAADALPGWRNSLFVPGLRSFSLSRVQLDGNNVVGEERLLEEFGFRLRGVVVGPDGYLYLLAENGVLLQVKPAHAKRIKENRDTN